MQRLEAKTVNGHTYYYFSLWGWKSGKCRRLSQKYLGKADLAEGPRHLELGGKKICLVHDWSHVGRDHLESADIVVCGHTHQPSVEHREGVLIVNPGECGGWLSGRCTVAILDTDRLAADIEEVYQQARS